MKKYPIVALGSGQGSTIEFFCQKTNKLPIQLKAILTENVHSNVIKVAKKFQIPCEIIDCKNKSFNEWDKELCEVLLIYKPQLILLTGFLKKIGPIVLSHFKNRIINSHPSLIPEFSGAGMYGSKIHEAVIQAHKKETGISLHIVDKNYDQGLLLAQKKIPVKVGENATQLEERIKKIEKDFYLETLLDIIYGKIVLP